MKSKIRSQFKKNKLIPIKKALILLSKINENITTSQIESFERRVIRALQYDFFNKSKVSNEDIEYIEEFYKRLYFFDYNYNLLSILAKLDDSNIENDSNIKFEFVKSCMKEIQTSKYINELNEFSNLLGLTSEEIKDTNNFFLRKATENAKLVKDINPLLISWIKNEGTETAIKNLNLHINDFKKQLTNPEINFSNKDFVYSLFFMLKFCIYKISNYVALQEQKRHLEEDLNGILNIDVEKNSISNIIKEAKNKLPYNELQNEIRRVQAFTKDFYEDFKKNNLFNVDRMFSSEELLKKNFVILVCSTDKKLDERRSFQSIIKKIARNKEVSIEETMYIINKFNFRAWLEYVDKNLINEFFTQKFE